MLYAARETKKADAARDAATSQFKVYTDLPPFRVMLRHEGATGAGDIALVGEERAVVDALGAVAAAADFIAIPFPVPGDDAALERTREALAAYANRTRR